MAKAFPTSVKVSSRSLTSPTNDYCEAYSLASSSTTEASRESWSSCIFSTTTVSLSASIVEATSMKEAIGLFLPILERLINAVAASYDPKELSLGMII